MPRYQQDAYMSPDLDEAVRGVEGAMQAWQEAKRNIRKLPNDDAAYSDFRFKTAQLREGLRDVHTRLGMDWF